MGKFVSSRAVTVGLVAGVGGFALLNRLGHSYGSTPFERTSAFPGDDIVTDPHCVCTHGITVSATPEQIWPWLVQMGWHRGGWYTARWVDRLLFPANLPSATEIQPQWQRLQVGDFIPDGAPETQCGFTVIDLVPNQSIVLRSTTHLPLTWRTRGIAGLEWTWVFVLRPLDDGSGTRFLFRWRGRVWPWWLRVLAETMIVPADLVMSRDMLRGVAARAEGARALTPARAEGAPGT